MNPPGPRASMRIHNGAFSLVEIMVALAVLAIIVVLISQLFRSAQVITGVGSKHMDADAQARAVFDRMAVDFAQMLKRPDVDYYLKDATNKQGNPGGAPGVNDQFAFYCQVPGYSTSAINQSNVSLVAYRVNTDSSSVAFNKLQRLGYGLVWNGISATEPALAFLPVTISQILPAATSMVADNNYELAGPQVFRMEYCYLLKGQTLSNGTTLQSQLSQVPWDRRITNISGIADHASLSGLRDVAAIVVSIAVIDSKSLQNVSGAQLAALAAKMQDFSDTMSPGDLETQWQHAIENLSGITPPLPRAVVPGIRVYSRYFYLSPGSIYQN